MTQPKLQSEAPLLVIEKLESPLRNYFDYISSESGFMGVDRVPQELRTGEFERAVNRAKDLHEIVCRDTSTEGTELREQSAILYMKTLEYSLAHGYDIKLFEHIPE